MDDRAKMLQYFAKSNDDSANVSIEELFQRSWRLPMAGPRSQFTFWVKTQKVKKRGTTGTKLISYSEYVQGSLCCYHTGSSWDREEFNAEVWSLIFILYSLWPFFLWVSFFKYLSHSRYMCLKWSSHELWSENFEILIFIECRTLNYIGPMTCRSDHFVKQSHDWFTFSIQTAHTTTHHTTPHHTTTHHTTPNITITCRPSHLSNQHHDHLNSPPRTTTNLVLTCREFISKHVESVAAKIDPELDIVDEIERQVRIWQNWKTVQYQNLVQRKIAKHIKMLGQLKMEILRHRINV